MTIDVAWATTKRIYIPRTDMPVVQVTPEVRELNLDLFRLNLKNLEASVEGMPWPDTHRHVTETTLSGFVYARLVEILTPYSVEFEDGQYTVRTTGANHNILDVKIPNQVSLAVQNSAGLINSPEIQHSSFDSVVSIDTGSGSSGTTYPTGSTRSPVNNLSDAITIAAQRGLSRIKVLSNLTIDPGVNASNMAFFGLHHNLTLTVDPAADVTDCGFNNLTIVGTMSGPVNIRDCFVQDISNVDGHITYSKLSGTIRASGLAPLLINDCWDGLAGGGTPIVDCGGNGSSGSPVLIRGFNGGLTLSNLSGANSVSIDGVLRLFLDSTVVSPASVIVRGIGKVTNQGTATVDSTGLVYGETINLTEKRSKIILAGVL